MITNTGDAKQELLNILSTRLSQPELSGDNKSVIECFIADATKGNIMSSDWQLLLKEATAPIDIPNKFGRTVLIQAAMHGEKRDVELLVALGANLEAKDHFDCTALLYAIHNKKWSTATALINLKANVNTTNDVKQTPLLMTAMHENIECINHLVELGAKLETKINGKSTLMYAIINEKWRAVAELIKLGADVNTTDTNNRDVTPLMMAALYENIECIHTLVEAGAKLEAKSSNSRTALMYAIISKKWGAVAVLIKLGATVNTTDNGNISPLMMAASYENIEYINKLVQLAADLEVKDCNGNTALMNSIIHKKWVVVAELIKVGANVDIKNVDGYTPKMLLSIINESAIAQLEKYGIRMTEDERISSKESYEKHNRHVQTIKEAGHILGFTCKILDTISVGISTQKGCLLLKKCLAYDKLSSIFRPNDLASIQQVLNIAIDSVLEEKMYMPSSIQHKILIENYMTKKPTFLPVHYSGHDFAIILWNDILVVCNRGDEALKNSISVFKIPSTKCVPNEITQFLETIMPTNMFLPAKKVLMGIRDFVGDVENPILTFDSKYQKHGTCAFVNLKSALQPFLCFLSLLQPDPYKLIELEKFNSTFLEPYLNDGPLAKELNEIKEISNNNYKHFTTAMRDWQADKLCDEFEKLPASSEERRLYLEIFTAILNEHYGQNINNTGLRPTKKIKTEKNRMAKILNAMTALGIFIRERDIDRTTTMLSAARIGQWNAVKILAEHGANIRALGPTLEAKNKDGNTPLMIAIINEQWDYASALIALKVNVNTADTGGATPLMMAAKHGNIECINNLMNAGAKLNLNNIDGNTALMIAVKFNQLDVVKVLIELGANVTTTSLDGETALTLAKNHQNEEMIKILEHAIKTAAEKQFSSESISSLTAQPVGWQHKKKHLDDKTSSSENPAPKKVYLHYQCQNNE